MIIFILQLLVYTWCRMQCVRTGYEISIETEEYHKQISIQNTLKIELERLKSPERIARIAKYQLGLVTPGENQKINIANELY
ncbi:septum formation initiator family protein [Desulfonema limicola]|nr:septum formation initiator family protein [Desulfonema limicola]